MLQSSLPTVIFDTGFTDRQPEHLPKWLRGWESHPPKEVYEASLCALVEFPAVKWPAESKLDRPKAGGVDGYRPHMSLLAGQVHYLSATTPMKSGKPPWCCPRQAEFWRLCRVLTRSL